MSNDVECRRCGRTVSEKSIQEGWHECDESALLDRIRELETDNEDLKVRVDELERITRKAGLQ
jgi:hypothetical protein